MIIKFRYFRLGLAIKFKNFVIDIGSKCMKKDIYLKDEEEEHLKIIKSKQDILEILNEEEKELIKD